MYQKKRKKEKDDKSIKKTSKNIDFCIPTESRLKYKERKE